MYEVTARMRIRDGAREGFEQKAAEIMRLTRELDEKTLRYDWFVSSDGTEIEVREAYVDADGVLDHHHHIAGPKAELFHSFADGHHMTFYDEPSPALAAALEHIPGVEVTRFSFLQGLGAETSRYKGLLDLYVELYNAGDVDGIAELYADDAVQLMPDGLYEGRDAIRERLAVELVGFSDVFWTVDSYLEQGDLFADEWTFAGTHTGPLTLPDGTQVPATGKRVVLKGMELVKMSDGKIVVDNLYYDNVSVLVQLGLVPQPATV